ncbi:arginine-tRNA-protein transferase [Pilobolus umbonatus]|nr:arginine-tRNA-protein transferase [Pilobolus umbonatus]
MSDSDDTENYSFSLVSMVGPSKHDCGYCKKKDSSLSYGIWAHSLTCSDYQDLIDRGWRRSGHYLYKPDLYKTCCPLYTIRLNTMEFHVTKGQKKVIHKLNKHVMHEDTEMSNKASKPKSIPKTFDDLMHTPDTQENESRLKFVLERSSFSKEKYDLYCKYQVAIHKDEPKELSESSFKRFLVNSPLIMDDSGPIKYGSFHQKYMLDGKLIALAVIDILPLCVSSVYFIYDPDYSFLSLGKYSALKEISIVKELNKISSKLQWYYMGYYIHNCPKMNYKGTYHPSDLLDPINYQWYPLDDFKKQLEDKPFVTYANVNPAKIGYTVGWEDPSKITTAIMKEVYILVGNERIAPVTCIVSYSSSPKFKQGIKDYVCAVGIDLAKKLILC